MKTTRTRLVWRTRPCGTEGNAAYQELKFSNLWPLLNKFQWKDQQLLSNLHWIRKINCSRNSSISEEVKLDKDVVADVRRGTCVSLQHQGSFCLVWISSWFSFAQDLESFLSPNSDLTPLELVELYALTGCQLICFNLSGNSNCHRSSCRVCLLLCRPFGSKRAGSCS